LRLSCCRWEMNSFYSNDNREFFSESGIIG
jgi:hypothetical protein